MKKKTADETRETAPSAKCGQSNGCAKRSLAAQEASAPEQSAAKAKKSKKRTAGQREMLLPIAGKGTAKEKAKGPWETRGASAEGWLIGGGDGVPR